MTFLELLKAIEKRPKMYFFNVDLDSLISFLNGYFYYKNIHDISYDEVELLYKNNFVEWLYNKYLLKDQKIIAWHKLLEAMYPENERAFQQFFRHFYEFIDEYQGA